MTSTVGPSTSSSTGAGPLAGSAGNVVVVPSDVETSRDTGNVVVDGTTEVPTSDVDGVEDGCCAAEPAQPLPASTRAAAHTARYAAPARRWWLGAAT